MFREEKTGKKYFWATLVVILFTFLPVLAAQETSVTATVDREEMGDQDTVTLTISAVMDSDSNANPPVLPHMEGFEVINRWQSKEARSSISSGPGGMKIESTNIQRFNYLLHPKKTGDLKISSVEVLVDGKSFHTKPIDIKVVAGQSGPPANNMARRRGQQRQMPDPFSIQPPPGFGEDDVDDVFSQLLRRGGIPNNPGFRSQPINPRDAFFIQVEVDKTEAYVNEQVTASWYLYTRGQIRDLDTLKYPSLKSFWKEDIEIATHLNFQEEIVNGVPYKKALLASFALFPIKEGTALIDPYTAKCTVITLNDIFGPLGGTQPRPYTKSSQAIKVNVKPLPTEGRPADFSGAVGNFQVTSRVDDNNIIEGQPFELKLRFEGRGNAKLIDVPPFQTPEGMELYDTQKDAKFFKSGSSYKDFVFLLIPRREGDFTIPGMSVSIFDPETKAYVARKTEPLLVRAQKAQPGSSQSLALQGQKSQPAVIPEPVLQREFISNPPVNPAAQAIGFGGLFAVVIGTLLWRARVELGWGQKKKDLMRRLHARIHRLQEAAGKGDWRRVGVEGTNTVYMVLGEVSGEGGANTELEKLLSKAPPSIRRELSGPLLRQMELLQTLSFAPEAAVGNLRDPESLRRIAKEVQELMQKAVNLGLSSEQSEETQSQI